MSAALNPDTARARLARVKAGVDSTRADIVAMYANQDWLELGYASWEALCDAEFGVRLALPREQRRTAVDELRAAGLSTRAIGSALGVAKTTVIRELAAPGPNGPPERRPAAPPRPVAGLDGKIYPPSRPAPTPKPVDPVVAERLRIEDEYKAGQANRRQRNTAIAKSIRTLVRLAEQWEREWFIDDWHPDVCDIDDVDITAGTLRQTAEALNQLATEWTDAD